MSALTRRQSWPFLDLSEWLVTPLAAFHSPTVWDLPVEDYFAGDNYVVRAELPGIDPEHELEVRVSDGILTITADRRADQADPNRSEFHYGVSSRVIVLPAGADDNHIEATYDRGILEITVTVRQQQPGKPGRRVPVRVIQRIKPT